MFFKSINGQNTGYYYKYDFEQYLTSKTSNPSEYLKKLKESIKYLVVARENKIEGRIDFLVINNGNNNSEILIKKKELRIPNQKNNRKSPIYFSFEQEVKKAFEKTDLEFLKENKEKFMTEISILFEITSYNTFSEDEKKVDLVIQGEEVKMKIEIIN